MSKVYYCPNCRIRQVSMPNMLCSNCSSDMGGFPTAGQASFPSAGDFSFLEVGQTSGGVSFGDENIDPGIVPPIVPKKQSTSMEGQNGGIPIPGNTGWDNYKPGDMTVQQGLRVDRNTYRGEVSNVSVHHVARRPSFIGRWFSSLINGAPFNMNCFQVNIQLSMDGQHAVRMNNLGTSRNVRLFVNEDNANLINSGNRLTILGKTDHNGVLRARSIYNESTMSRIPCGISPWVIRVITLMLIGAIYMLLHSDIQLFGPLPSLQSIGDKAYTLVALALIMVVVFFSARRNPRLRSILLWGLVILLTALIAPQLGTIVIILLGIRIMIGGLF